MALALVTVSMWRPKSYHGEKEGDKEIKRSIRQTDSNISLLKKARRPVIKKPRRPKKTKVCKCGKFSLVRKKTTKALKEVGLLSKTYKKTELYKYNNVYLCWICAISSE